MGKQLNAFPLNKNILNCRQKITEIFFDNIYLHDVSQEIITSSGTLLLHNRKQQNFIYSYIFYPQIVTTNIQLFRQRLSHQSVKVYATMPIGIMGSDRLALLGWGSRCFSKKEVESMNTRVCAVSFCHAETPWTAFKQTVIHHYP